MSHQPLTREGPERGAAPSRTRLSLQIAALFRGSVVPPVASPVSAPTPTSILHRHQDRPLHPFEGVERLKEVVQEAIKDLRTGTLRQQYITFGPVANEASWQLTDSDEWLGRVARMAYDVETRVLIAKLIPTAHEKAFSSGIVGWITMKLSGMGLSPPPLAYLHRTRYHGSRASKEPDFSLRPLTRSAPGAPPSIVFESGRYEAQLRRDAAWWLTNSNELVKIVVLLSISVRTRALVIEKWVLGEGNDPEQNGTTLRQKARVKVPVRETLISVTPIERGSQTLMIIGAPLVLEFDRLFDRPPTSPEADVRLSGTDLKTFAARIWNSTSEELSTAA